MGLGFRLLNFETPDAAALDLPGLATSGVLDLERDVEGHTLRARAVHLDPRSTPEGYIGIAQHLTPEHVRGVEHPNGAHGLAAVRIEAAGDEFDAIVDRYSRMLGAAPARPGVFTVGEARLEIVRGPASRLAGMTIAVADLARARRVVEGGDVPTETTDDGFAADDLSFTEES